jgi:hypothetical protein
MTITLYGRDSPARDRQVCVRAKLHGRTAAPVKLLRGDLNVLRPKAKRTPSVLLVESNLAGPSGHSVSCAFQLPAPYVPAEWSIRARSEVQSADGRHVSDWSKSGLDTPGLTSLTIEGEATER